MPAPRTCRSCGADLVPDIRWCTRCYAPVTEFAARPSMPGGSVHMPRHDVRYTRWRKGPLTFGPVGRLLATALVVLMGPWGALSVFSLLYTPVWIAVSVIVLKQIWRKERLDADAPPSAFDRFRERHPVLGHRFKGATIVIALAAMLLVVGAMVMIQTDTAGRSALAVVAAVIGLGCVLAWLANV